MYMKQRKIPNGTQSNIEPQRGCCHPRLGVEGEGGGGGVGGFGK